MNHNDNTMPFSCQIYWCMEEVVKPLMLWTSLKYNDSYFSNYLVLSQFHCYRPLGKQYWYWLEVCKLFLIYSGKIFLSVSSYLLILLIRTSLSDLIGLCVCFFFLNSLVVLYESKHSLICLLQQYHCLYGHPYM